MAIQKLPEGFSSLNANEKIALVSKLVDRSNDFSRVLEDHMHKHSAIQERYSDFSENTLSNYYLPYSIAPNFRINNKIYHIPMVTEESSVVAAAASAAKFWANHGGFNCKNTGNIKKGQIHFYWKGNSEILTSFFKENKIKLITSLSIETKKMESRGGGIKNIELLTKDNILKNYFQLEVSFDTVDSMGANFMNTCLETIALNWKKLIEDNSDFNSQNNVCDILMSIFSNYTPEYRTQCEVKTAIDSFKKISGNYSAENFVKRFVDAIAIANNDTSRAVTHNKGIFNGIDAVAIATGNDFRAVEANGHAYAAKGGQYKSLSNAFIDGQEFVFNIEIPLAMGIVGGATQIHPLARYSLEILDCHSALELQKIALAVGLANNFSAIRSLITTGIQSGHMSLHLNNILNQIQATEIEKELAKKHFHNKLVSYGSVRYYLEKLRMNSND